MDGHVFWKGESNFFQHVRKTPSSIQKSLWVFLQICWKSRHCSWLSQCGEGSFLFHSIHLSSMLWTVATFTHRAHLLEESEQDDYYTDPASEKTDRKSQMRYKLWREVSWPGKQPAPRLETRIWESVMTHTTQMSSGPGSYKKWMQSHGRTWAGGPHRRHLNGTHPSTQALRATCHCWPSIARPSAFWKEFSKCWQIVHNF